MSQFGLIINFTDEQELINYLTDFREYQIKKIKKDLKKEHDERGKHIINFHQKAKEYHDKNPELSYKECYKIVNKKDNLINSNG